VGPRYRRQCTRQHDEGKGTGQSLVTDENVGVVLAVRNLPDASIDGANMRAATYEHKVYGQFVKHAPSLDELLDQSKVWRGRTPRSCLDQWKKIINDCTSLHGRLQQAQRANPTGNPSNVDLMRVAVGLFNKSIRLSGMYDVIKNKAYNIGNRFIFLNCYELLLGRFPARLQPTAVAMTTVGVERASLSEKHFGNEADGGDGGYANGNGGGPAGAPQARPQGSKAAKRARRSKSEVDSVAGNLDSVSGALPSYTATFKAVSERSLA
jgi:hypothetical protein